jgi:CMP-N-acetylneuraminic acid synthetase
MQKLTAILPIKGYSERVPHKNIRNFAGKPLLFHIIDTLMVCSLIDTILVNTDNERVAELVQTRNKVRVLERPISLCGDMVPMNDIIAYDLQFASTEHVLQTHTTNPLLKAYTIEQGIDLYFKNMNKYNSLFSVTRRQVRFYRENGSPVNHNPGELLRTQDTIPLYEENSCLYIFSQRSFREAGNKRIGNMPYMFPLNALEAVDIDDEEDFILAELLALHNERVAS